MLGFRYAKFPPTTFVLQFKNGRVRREGTGISFFYFEPRSTIVAVPVGSTDVPFIFNEVTQDFQAVTVQGHLTYRVAEPARLAALLDYSWRAGAWTSEDPAKLPLRVGHAAQTATRAEVQACELRRALVEGDALAARIHLALKGSPALRELGVEILGFAILALRPVPETGRALEAEARERLLREADDAVYSRRNNAVEQERRVRENELLTEVAVQAKTREIEETKLAGEVALEEQRRALVALEAENRRTQADAQSYASEAQLRPLRELDPKALQVLAAGSTDPRLLVAMAFQEIAANATKVGTLNISPDLLDSLLQKNGRAA
jgi:hypothetical protein